MSELSTLNHAQLEHPLADLIEQIVPLDQQAMDAATARQAQLTKPPGALGRLEQLSIQLAGIRRVPSPSTAQKLIIVMAGDHGVTEEGISAFPSSVTAQMVQNFLAGGAAINVMARQANARLVVADLGVATELAAQSGLLNAKIAPGTANFVQGPAMRPEQALAAIQVGIEVVQKEIAQGVDVVGIGEMGIGNTTAAAAIAAALTGIDAAQLVGPGTGLDDDGVAHKSAVVQRALDCNQPNPTDGLDVLAKVGGFEIGGLVGVMLGAAAQQRPILVDGLIATAAAMVAVTVAPALQPYLIAAHRSAEPGHDRMLAWLGLTPLLDLQLRLGEGTGAALAMHVVDAACRTLAEMATFDEADVDTAA